MFYLDLKMFNKWLGLFGKATASLLDGVTSEETPRGILGVGVFKSLERYMTKSIMQGLFPAT